MSSHPYDALQPDTVLDALATIGLHGDGRLMPLSSYENRVYHLTALWEMEADIRWCDNDGLAILDATVQEECPFCGQETRMRPLTDVLVDLAAARGTINFDVVLITNFE